MKLCMHKIETVKVPQGNAFQLLLPFKTARWENNELVPDNIDIRYLTDVTITIDGEPWTDYEMDERGPIVQKTERRRSQLLRCYVYAITLITHQQDRQSSGSPGF